MLASLNDSVTALEQLRREGTRSVHEWTESAVGLFESTLQHARGKLSDALGGGTFETEHAAQLEALKHHVMESVLGIGTALDGIAARQSDLEVCTRILESQLLRRCSVCCCVTDLPCKLREEEAHFNESCAALQAVLEHHVSQVKALVEHQSEVAAAVRAVTDGVPRVCATARAVLSAGREHVLASRSTTEAQLAVLPATVASALEKQQATLLDGIYKLLADTAAEMCQSVDGCVAGARASCAHDLSAASEVIINGEQSVESAAKAAMESISSLGECVAAGAKAAEGTKGGHVGEVQGLPCHQEELLRVARDVDDVGSVMVDALTMMHDCGTEAVGRWRDAAESITSGAPFACCFSGCVSACASVVGRFACNGSSSHSQVPLG
jgi:hypothetical protein